MVCSNMQRLALEDYDRARPMFESLRYNLVVDSVLAGNTPAWVYVDNVDVPHTAWMWDLQDAMLVAGDTENPATLRALAGIITDQVISDAQARYIPQLSLHYDTAAWEGVIPTVLPGLQPEKAMRRYYTFAQPLMPQWHARVPEGCVLQLLDAELLARQDLRYMEHVVGWVRSFWHSEADFLNTGFGFALLEGDTVASWCLSVFASGDAFELGLATVTPYRRRGYATLVAAASVAHCVEQGGTPHWHCWEDNAPSQRVAEKVGFVDPKQYTVYRFALQEA